jgi:hypothetical protein
MRYVAASFLWVNISLMGATGGDCPAGKNLVNECVCQWVTSASSAVPINGCVLVDKNIKSLKWNYYPDGNGKAQCQCIWNTINPSGCSGYTSYNRKSCSNEPGAPAITCSDLSTLSEITIPNPFSSQSACTQQFQSDCNTACAASSEPIPTEEDLQDFSCCCTTQ